METYQLTDKEHWSLVPIADDNLFYDQMARIFRCGMARQLLVASSQQDRRGDEVVAVLRRFEDKRLLAELYSAEHAKAWASTLERDGSNERELAALCHFIQQNPMGRIDDADPERHPRIVKRFLEHLVDTVKSPRNVTLGKWIGSGGFGQVYEATCQVLNSSVKVALKKSKGGDDPCFGREMDALKQLDHLFIVGFFGTTVLQSTEYIVLEWCDGNLEQYVGLKSEELTLADCRAILGQAVQAMCYLHSKNMVHKDVKPENILYRETGCRVVHVKLSDFGSSRQLQATSDLVQVLLGEPSEQQEVESFRTTRNIGTRGYISPELLKTGQPSFESDVWAMGAVVFFVVSKGQHPFALASLNNVDFVVARMKNPPNLAKLNDWAAAHLVGQLLQFDRQKRPSILAVQLHPFFSTASQSAKMHLIVNVNDCFLRFRNDGRGKFLRAAFQESKLKAWHEGLDKSFKSEEDPRELAKILKRFPKLNLASLSTDVPEKVKGALERDLSGSQLIDQVDEPLITEMHQLTGRSVNLFFLYVWHVLSRLPMTREEAVALFLESELTFAMFHCPVQFYKHLAGETCWTQSVANQQLGIAATMPTSDVLRFLLSAESDQVVQRTIASLRSADNVTTPLHIAANCSPTEDTVGLLIEKMGNVKSTTADRMTALHHAANHNVNAKLISMLLDAGADVDARDDKGWTPLHHAARYSTNLQVAQLLVARGADLNAITGNKRETALHLACHNVRNGQVVAYLIGQGLNVHATAKNDWTPLHYAANVHDDPRIVQLLIENRAVVDSPSVTNGTPLHHAAYQNPHPQVIACLIGQGADIEATDDFGWTPLHYAIRYNSNRKVTQLLLDKGASVTAATENRWTPLHLAASSNPQLVATLLTEQADPNCRTDRQWSPLHLLVQRVNEIKESAATYDPKEEIECADLLIANRLQVDAADDEGFTALHLATIGSLELLKHLIAKGAAVDPVSVHGTTPLYHASKYGNEEMVHCLISNGANVDVSDKLQVTLLQCLARQCVNVAILKKLIDAGANLKAVDDRQRTLLHLAVRFNPKVEVTTTLISCRLDIDAVDVDGYTPLVHAIVDSQNIRVVEELIKAGADVKRRFSGGWTPLHFAAEHNLHTEVVRLLIGAGADLKATGDEGETALHQAARSNRNHRVVRLLLDAGADPEAKDKSGETPIDWARENPMKNLILSAFEGDQQDDQDEDLEFLNDLLT